MPLSPTNLGQIAQGLPPNYGPLSDKEVMHDIDPMFAINPDFELGLPPNVDYGMVQKNDVAPVPLNQLTPMEQLGWAHALEQPIAYQTVDPAQVHAALQALMAVPTQDPVDYTDAVANAPMSFADALNSTLAAMNPAPEAAPEAAPDQANALAEAQGYADSQASPTGYGYGLNLGAPSTDDTSTATANESAATSVGAQE